MARVDWQNEMHEGAPKDRAFLAYVPKLGGWVVVDPRDWHDDICYGLTRPNRHKVFISDVMGLDDLPAIPACAR